MSDTTAFLSGCAITGVGIVLMMGGGMAIGQYRAPVPTQSLPPTSELPAVPLPAPSSSGVQDAQDQLRMTGELDRQRTEIEGLKTQVADLKTQIEKQQTDAQRLTLQLQQQQAQMDAMTVQRARPIDSLDQPTRFQTITLGAMGVVLMVVIVGGGMILVGIIVLIVQSQRRHRPMQVIHPIQPPYSFSTQEFLPPAAKARRTRQIEYYED